MLGLGAGEHGSAGTDAWSSERLSNWLVAVIEAPSAQSGAASARDVDMAVVAVETSTGDVLYSQFRCADSRWPRWQCEDLHVEAAFLTLHGCVDRLDFNVDLWQDMTQSLARYNTDFSSVYHDFAVISCSC